MSQFCGKCDFYDGFVEIRCGGDEEKIKEELKKLKLYVRGKDGRDHLVKSDTIKDIAKYYPYLEAIACSSDDGFTVILSSDSFIDQEEKEYLDWKIIDVLKWWRKCKRNKKPFNVDECVEKLSWMNTDQLRIIAERVAKDGEKAEFDDLHDPMHEHCRKRWYEELRRIGYTQIEAYNWVYKGLFTSKKEMEERLGEPIEE